MKEKKILYLNYYNNQGNSVSSRKFPFLIKLLGYPDPRIDFKNPFLADANKYLEPSEYLTYAINEQFYKAKSYKDLLQQNDTKLDFVPDYVIIELPPIINTNYPTELFTHSDIDILVCRSNRLWSEADQTAVDGLHPFSDSKMHFVLNGVELKEIEAILGDLPRKRSELRKKIKKMFQLQFFTKSQI